MGVRVGVVTPSTSTATSVATASSTATSTTMIIASATSTAFVKISHLLVVIRLEITSALLLLHHVPVPGNVGALSGRHLLQIFLCLTFIKVLGVRIKLALAPRMRVLLSMTRDWTASLGFLAGRWCAAIALVAFLVVLVVAIIRGLALVLEERVPMAQHVLADFLRVKAVIGVVRVLVLVVS